MPTFKSENEANQIVACKKMPRVEVRLNLSHEDYEIIQAISYSGHFSYKYPAEFFRDAIRTQIDKLSSEEHLGQIVTQYDRLQAARYNSMFEVLARKVHKSVAAGRFGKAKADLKWRVARVRNEPRNMWRDWFLGEVHGQLFPVVNDPYGRFIAITLGRGPGMCRRKNGS
jgi:hypothetical protein